ncbi:MAG: hypothetical protein WAS36_03115, partial [Candidatus Saccharimonadales bacterium]
TAASNKTQPSSFSVLGVAVSGVPTATASGFATNTIGDVLAKGTTEKTLVGTPIEQNKNSRLWVITAFVIVVVSMVLAIRAIRNRA